jgi:hypothetical protein
MVKIAKKYMKIQSVEGIGKAHVGFASTNRFSSCYSASILFNESIFG